MAQVLPHTATPGVTLSEVLRYVPGCTTGKPPIAVVALHGGTANAVYRVRTDCGIFVVRLNDISSGLLGVDRRREAVLHQAAASAGLAPAIVMADAADRFLISEYIDGPTWRHEYMSDPQRLRVLARRIRALHELAPPISVERLDLMALLTSHVSRLVAADPSEKPLLDGWLRRAEAILTSEAMTGRAPCIIHNDLHHLNIIDTGNLRFIDWEYAGVGDPLFDLACLLTYYPELTRHAPLLLAESGLSTIASEAALMQAAWVFTFLSYLWFRSRRLIAPASSVELASEQALLERLRAQ